MGQNEKTEAAGLGRTTKEQDWKVESSDSPEIPDIRNAWPSFGAM